MKKPSHAQMRMLEAVAVWSKGEPPTYMPFADQRRTAEACERHGWLKYLSVDSGARYNGYALTETGEELLNEYRAHAA